MKKIVSMLMVLTLMLSFCVPFAFADTTCDHSLSSQSVKFLTYGKRPSCEEDGYSSVYYCKTCGKYLHDVGEDEFEVSDDATPIVLSGFGGHEWEYEEIPTTGTHTKRCTRRGCDASEVEDCVGCWATGCEKCESELIGIHPDKDGDCHCDGCDGALDHDPEWAFDENNHWMACPYDEDKVVEDAKPHEFGEWTETKPATEEACGEEARECECGYVETRETDKLPHEHDYTFSSKVVEPTCAEKGYTEKACKCGDTQKVDFVDELKDHTWGEWTETKKATMTEEGEETRECSVCEKKETRATEKVPHVCAPSNDKKDKKKPTCTEDGYTGDEVCVICEKVLKKGEVIPKTGHDEKNATIKGKKDPTCRKEGYTGDLVCPECDGIIEKGEAIKKLGHNFKKGFCTRCGADESNPQTGDPIVIFMTMMAVSGAGLIGIGGTSLYKKKFGRKE